MRSRPLLLLGLLATLLALPSAAAAAKRPASAGPPADSTQTRNLSQPRYETVRDVVRVPAFDGEELYLEVVRPKAAGRFPVILESSPYHGTLADATARGSCRSRATPTASPWGSPAT